MDDTFKTTKSNTTPTRFGSNRVAVDIQGNGGDDFLVKTELRFGIMLRFGMSMAKTG